MGKIASQEEIVKRLRAIMAERNLAGPWSEVMHKEIHQMRDSEILSLFSPESGSYTNYRKMSFILETVKTCPDGGEILDIGCGTGSLVRYLACNGVRPIFGIDQVDSVVRCAELLAEVEGLSCRFVRGNFMDAHLITRGSAKAVILDSVLEHVQKYKLWIERIAELLALGGLAIIIVPSIWGGHSLLRDWDYLRFRWKPQPYNYHPLRHCNHFWHGHLCREFASAGLVHVRSYKFQAYLAFFAPLLKRYGSLKFFWNFSKLDYLVSKILPRNMATRVSIFRKTMSST